jgi:hypothetical protein
MPIAVTGASVRKIPKRVWELLEIKVCMKFSKEVIFSHVHDP